MLIKFIAFIVNRAFWLNRKRKHINHLPGYSCPRCSPLVFINCRLHHPCEYDNDKMILSQDRITILLIPASTRCRITKIKPSSLVCSSLYILFSLYRYQSLGISMEHSSFIALIIIPHGNSHMEAINILVNSVPGNLSPKLYELPSISINVRRCHAVYIICVQKLTTASLICHISYCFSSFRRADVSFFPINLSTVVGVPRSVLNNHINIYLSINSDGFHLWGLLLHFPYSANSSMI